MSNYRYVIRVHEMTAANIQSIEETLNNIVRYDGSMTIVQTHVGLLKRLEVLMSNQMECRMGFSIGIAVIVGILLTALASMEFRQNEYVYTLMKSFGVRPLLLILTFIVENIFLIGISFAGAVWAFMKTQKIVLGEFFKLGDTVLTYADIRQDLWLLGISLFRMRAVFFHSGRFLRLSPYRKGAEIDGTGVNSLSGPGDAGSVFTGKWNGAGDQS